MTCWLSSHQALRTINRASPRPPLQDVYKRPVEAINADGGRRTFTASDYPEFIITDSAAVSFFKYFTCLLYTSSGETVYARVIHAQWEQGMVEIGFVPSYQVAAA